MAEKPSGKKKEDDSSEEQPSGKKSIVLRKEEELLEVIKKAKKTTLSEATKEIGLEKGQVAKLAELLRREGKIKINIKFLRDPELEVIQIPGRWEAKAIVPAEQKKLAAEVKPKEQVKPERVPQPAIVLKPAGGVEDARKGAPRDVEPARSIVMEPVAEKGNELDKYDVVMGNTRLPVRILDVGDYVYHYSISVPHIDFITKALLDEVKRSLVGEVQIETRDIVDTEKFIRLKSRFLVRSKEKLRNVLKEASDEYIEILSKIVVNDMVGLGEMEYLLSDDYVEDVVVNSSRDVVWVYHKKHGWLKTNLLIPTEAMIQNYSARVAREIGREITHLQPLLDAHLVSGDRVNATLAPISTFGNTMSIRRFSRIPWTMTHFMDPELKTISVEAAAFLWMAMEYEMSILVSGGTASGKTSMLNALMPFMPANQRVISMEDTRELNLPEYLHWVPMAIRAPNPQGEGEVSMLDLIVNALRMRPDRIIVGEVRRKRETEVLFEAMHTGHSVYGTFHAEQSHELVDRITSPPMEIPGQVMKSLQLIVVQYRNRRTGHRRTFEITELTKEGEGDKPGLNTLYKWHPKTDTIEPLYPSVRVKEELELFGGLSERETEEDLAGKMEVLKWMLDKNISNVNDFGKIVAQYYLDPDVVLESVKSNKSLK